MTSTSTDPADPADLLVAHAARHATVGVAVEVGRRAVAKWDVFLTALDGSQYRVMTLRGAYPCILSTYEEEETVAHNADELDRLLTDVWQQAAPMLKVWAARSAAFRKRTQ